MFAGSATSDSLRSVGTKPKARKHACDGPPACIRARSGLAESELLGEDATVLGLALGAGVRAELGVVAVEVDNGLTARLVQAV